MKADLLLLRVTVLAGLITSESRNGSSIMSIFVCHVQHMTLQYCRSYASIVLQGSKPSYKDLERILRGVQGSKSSQTWAERLRSEFDFNRESLNRKGK